ncbi:DUF2341 domain-containing protein [Candidatus Parcubacteria bacterium]|nr:DUF2341 domain-containing protein [Candidatus Parcubacteria bacterium]
MQKIFRQKMTSCALAFLIIFQTIIGVFAPMNFSLDSPYLESRNAEAAANWYGTAGWGYRKKITIDNTKVSNTNQANFPVLVNRSDDDWKDTGSGGNVGQTDGGDFLFTSSDGQTKLSHEIEKYTNTTGELIAWVKIPTLSASVDTDIYLYYGNASCADQWDAAGGTWDSSFEMVQHLQETGANPQVVDSTSNSNDSATNTSDPTTSGQIDGAMDFTFANSDYINVGSSASLDDITTITICAWVYANSYSNDDRIFAKDPDGVSGKTFDVREEPDNYLEYRQAFVTNGGYWHSPVDSLPISQWHYVCATYDNSSSDNNPLLYINGSSVAVNESKVPDGVAMSDASYDAIIGNRDDTGRGWNGTIDEVRISSTIRSADWIATEYNNQSDPSNFYNLGIEDTYNMDHFVITGSASQTAGVPQTITITAKDSGGSVITAYAGDKVLTFSGANNAPDATVPTFSDKDSADIALGSDTTLTFTNGVATSSMKLYKAESAEIEVDDTLYNSTGSVDYDLNVTVAGATLNNFTVEAPATATSGIAFSTTITSRDEFNNTTLIVSGDTTVAVDQGNIDTATLAQAQFTDDGIWTDNLTITNITEQPAVSLSATNGSPTGNDSITVLGIPADPSGCSASRVSDTNFTITWSDNSTVETGYEIERKTDGGSWTQIDTDTNGSPYSDTTTSADHKYEYQVLGYNSVGDSASYSTDAVEHYTTPDTPSNVAGAYVSDGEFTITYTDNAAVEDTHRIERCSNGNCDGTYETDLATFESYPQTDTTNLAVNSRYRWRARSETPDALTSNYGTSNYNYTTPTAPTIGTPVYVADNNITVNWTDTSAYEDGFRVWVSEDNGTFTEVTSGANTVGAGIETYSYTSSANHSYKFKITAHSPNDLISADSAESVIVYTIPSAPTIGTPVWISDNDITVNWTDNSNHEDGFRVWVSEDDGAYAEATPGINSTTTDIITYSYTGGSLSHNYKFKVQSHLVNNDLSELVNMSGESITVYTTTDAPIIGTPVADSSTAITWNWTDNSSDEESFRLDFIVGDGTDVDDILLNTETHQTTGLDPNTQYAVHIHSYRADRGESSASADATIYTLANIPTELALTADSQNQIIASYAANSNSNITQYYVENITAGTNSGWTTSLNWASDGLACGEEYIFKVKARNGDEIETIFTDTVSAKTQNCGSGLPPSASNPPSVPEPTPENPTGEFSVLINNGDEYTTNSTVSLKLTGGADTTKMAISDNPEFDGASQITFQENIEWELTSGRNEAVPRLYGINIVYAKFYTQYGVASEVVSDSIILDTVNQEEEQEKQEEDIEDTEDTGEEYKPAESDEPSWIDIPEEAVEPETQEPSEPAEPDEPSIIDDIIDIFKPDPEPDPEPEIKIEDLVAKETPASMKGEWDLFPQEQINEFVLAPLPKGLERLAQKFPELQNTFKEVGISKITDLQKLRDYSLSLSGLTKSLGLEEKDLALVKDLSLSEFPQEIKNRIPTEIIFAQIGGENNIKSVDFDIKLSVNDQGETQQKIRAIAGKKLFLTIKTESKAKSVYGYLAFKGTSAVGSIVPQGTEGAIVSAELWNPECKTCKCGSTASLRCGSVRTMEPSVKDKFQNLLNSFVFARPVFAQDYDNIEEKFITQKFAYADEDNDGIWTAEIQAPIVEGEYEVITLIEYEDPELGTRMVKLTTVVDPEGYVYERIKNQELRIKSSIVSIYQLNSESGEYELWQASNYNQKNPQTTDATGRYSFLVPEGTYYITAEASDYLSYQSEPFAVQEGAGVHQNIELKIKGGWLKALDWKVLAIFLLFVLVVWNFWRDRRRN